MENSPNERSKSHNNIIDRASDYVNDNGEHCPFCKSLRIIPFKDSLKIHSNTITQDNFCEDCGNAWEGIYTLSGLRKK